MKLQITEWKPFTGTAKALKGHVNIRVTTTDADLNVFEIKDITYFDNGSKRWVQFPEKRTKNLEGKWVTEVAYFYVLEPKSRFQDILLAEIARFLAERPQETHNEESLPF